MQLSKVPFQNVQQSIHYRSKRLLTALRRGWLPYLIHGFTPKPHDLAVLAIFKDESHILEEWVNHYSKQGATRIHLVDNGSTDSFRTVLAPFIQSGLVVLHQDCRRYHQQQIYNALLPIIKREADWLIVCDLDEFIYARLGHGTVASYLRGLGTHITTVRIPWKMFGSSGHLTQPIEGVRKGFVRRAWYGPNDLPDCHEVSNIFLSKIPTQTQRHSTYVKCISRTRRIVRLYIHHHWLLFGSVILSNSTPCECSSEATQVVSEDLLASCSLHLNHYPIQSLAFFRDVKMKRGSADYVEFDKVYDRMEYFYQYDTNDYTDDELAAL